ncbi:MAG: enoyl-CoA hydratase/isomerase family protein [Rhodothermales bacterium]|nr:enoyl-CoA hydratase/isomerase family protein [Rhodothermales bacterium]
MNHPDNRNALNYNMVSDLINAFNEVKGRDSVRAVVLTGAGSAFSAGADLKALEALSSATFDENLQDSSRLAELFETIYRFPKVVIARINGHAIAGGTGLAAVCDFAIASEEAKMGFTEVRIGFVPAIVMVFVTRKLREADSRDLMLRGHLIQAAEAADMGLINMAVSADALDDTVSELALEIATMTSSQSIERTKRLLAEIQSMSISDGLKVAARENAEARATEDCLAGITAFLAKKTPPWQN